MLEVPKKYIYMGGKLQIIFEVIDDQYFKQTDVKFPKYFLIKWKLYHNVYNFIPVDVKKTFQQIGLEHGLFSHIVKIKRTIIGEAEMD